MAVLYGNDTFSILVLLTKKRYYSFLKKVFFSINFVSKFKYWKRSSDCHIKTCRSLKWKILKMLFWKTLVPFFRKTCALSVGFKTKPPIKSIFKCYKTKTNSSFAVKHSEMGNHSFLASIDESTFSSTCTFNWLCKHMVEVGQKHPSSHFCT